MRGSSSDQPKSPDDPLYASDVPPARSSRPPSSGAERVPPPPINVAADPPSGGSGGDRPPGYQSEERYWTDYLRIALPIAGLLLLLSVFWYWASSFIGGDETSTQTPVVAVNLTPETAPTFTPTLESAVVLPTPTTGVLQPTVAPTEVQAQPTEAPTQPPAEPTTAPATGEFQEGDLVIVNDNDVNMRSSASTSADVVDTLSQGTELRILSSTPTEADGYTWWNVSDDALDIQGWVASQFLEK